MEITFLNYRYNANLNIVQLVKIYGPRDWRFKSPLSRVKSVVLLNLREK